MAMTMTLDGLVRALRWKAHDLAEDVERERGVEHGLESTGMPAPNDVGDARKRRLDNDRGER